MICSAMSIMAFAANGDVYWFEGSSSSFAFTTTDTSGATRSISCRVYYDGSWHDYDGTFFWNSLYCTLSNSANTNLEYSVSGATDSFTRYITISKVENNNRDTNLFKIRIILDKDDESVSVAYAPYISSGNLGTYIPISATCNVELM